MRAFLVRIILPLLLIVTAFLIAYFRHPSNDLLDVSHSSSGSQIAPTRRKNNSRDSNINARDAARITRTEDIHINENFVEMIKDANLLSEDEGRGQKLKRIAHLWSLKDPDACLEWALSIPSNQDGFNFVVAQVFATLCGNDQTEKATQLLNKIPQGRLRDSALGYALWGILDLPSPDIGSAGRLLTMITSESQMKQSTGTLSRELIESNRFHDLQELYDSLSFGTLKETLGSSVLRNLVDKDPSTGFDWILKNAELQNVENFETLAFRFAKIDPLQGLELSDRIGEKAIKKSYVSSLLASWATKNPTVAGQWVIDKMATTSFDQIKGDFSNIARNSIARDSNLIFSQIQNIRDQDQKNAATLSAATALSEYDPRRAADLVRSTITARPEEQQNAVAITARNWLKRDPLEASKWVGGLASGPLRDTAVSELVYNILSKDRDVMMANSWAAQIRDPKIRAQVNAKIDKTKP